MLHKRNKIYSLYVKEKPGLVKVGDTIRSVIQRNNETIINASLHKDHDLCRHWLAEDYTGRTFRDYEIHAVLEEQGYERELNELGHKSEWFKNINNDIIAKAIEIVAKKPPLQLITLRNHQQIVLDEMLEADKFFNLLNLAPRFGKTYLILEYAQALTEQKYDNVYLVIASKNLSSNSSFEDSYNGSHKGKPNYEFKLISSSLFVNDEIILEKLDNIPKNANVILVTDEADLASHSTISREKLRHIKEKLNVVKQIVMTGTGIYKADKIIRDESIEENTFRKTVTYSDLFELSENIVKRNFITAKMTMQEDSMMLNIAQSFAEARRHKKLVPYIDTFLYKNPDINISEDSKVAMVFINTKLNSHLVKFSKEYKSQHPDTIVTTITSEEGYSNKDSERKIKRLLRRNPGKKVVIFSRQMSSRSFSISEIDLVINMADGPLTNASIQKISRGLTQNNENTKKSSNIVLISFTDVSLGEDLFLSEHENILNETESTIINKAKRFFSLNDFSSFIFDATELTFENETDYGELFIDKLLKFSDSARYILGRIYDLDLDIDFALNSEKKRKDITKSKKTLQPSKKSESEPKEKKKNEKDNYKLKEIYSELLVCLPYISHELLKANTITELIGINEKDWDSLIPFSKESFIQNLENNGFEYQIETLFRNYDPKKNKTKIIEYMDANSELSEE